MAAYIDGAGPGLNPKESGPGDRKIGMQFKMFSADNPDGIVKAVNAWLSGERGIKILHTETRPVVTDMAKGFSGLLFSIWYDQDGQ